MFDIADIWATRTGNQVRLVSANDHIHARHSAHYAGLALDLLSSRPDDLAQLFREIGYRVLWRVPGHFGHIHVQEATRPLVPDNGLQTAGSRVVPGADGVSLVSRSTAVSRPSVSRSAVSATPALASASAPASGAAHDVVRASNAP